ncbi:transcription initiation factor TFIID subunit 4-like [Lepus europaeus]|uniref:transcription initiation factor TFIID subunit 4-like n=1 Tax=Lepus europaeus TaxID=9983 RepID=UPI002B48A080|nr:transcription initiation factor TFIID subunit 4-like [Lepus europaeus]
MHRSRASTCRGHANPPRSAPGPREPSASFFSDGPARCPLRVGSGGSDTTQGLGVHQTNAWLPALPRFCLPALLLLSPRNDPRPPEAGRPRTTARAGLGPGGAGSLWLPHFRGREIRDPGATKATRTNPTQAAPPRRDSLARPRARRAPSPAPGARPRHPPPGRCREHAAPPPVTWGAAPPGGAAASRSRPPSAGDAALALPPEPGGSGDKEAPPPPHLLLLLAAAPGPRARTMPAAEPSAALLPELAEATPPPAAG